jgi:CRP-like cAMP-binding protein
MQALRAEGAAVGSHKKDWPALIGRVAFFRSLNEEQLDRVIGIAHEEHYAPGKLIFQQDDKGDCLYLIVAGYVRIFLMSDDGREITFRVYGVGDAFGEFAVLDEQPRSAGAAAIGNVVVLSIRRREFLELMRDNFDVVLSVLGMLTERLRFTTSFAQDLAFLKNTQRLAAILVQFAARARLASGITRITATQQELADYAGCSREWVNKALQTFAHYNTIVLEEGGLLVVDEQRLQLWAASHEKTPPVIPASERRKRTTP